MSLIGECLVKLVRAGKINKDAADAALGLHEGMQGRLELFVPPTHAEAMAALQAAKVMAAAAKRKKVTAAKQAIRYSAAEQRVRSGKGTRASRLIGLLTRGLYEGGQNVDSHAEVILGELFRRSADMVEAYRSSAAGLRSGARGNMEPFIREIFGENTGDQTARAAAKGFADANEYGVERALQAGMDMPELEEWRVPQFWEASRVKRRFESMAVAEARWSAKIMEAVNRGGLELMNKETKAPATALQLPAVSAHAFRDIVHQEELSGANMRVFRFKNADTWLEFQREFGPGSDVNIAQMLTHHLGKMARQIALAEVLGPNHRANFRALHKLAMDERLESSRLARVKGTFTVDTPWVAENAYKYMTGALSTTDGEMLAGIFGGLRNIQTAAKLGSAVVTAVPGDSVLSLLAARHVGIPGFNVVTRAMRQMVMENSDLRRQMARMNIVAHAVNDTVLGNRRFEDEIVGKGLTGQAAAFIVRAQGLQAWTEALKRAWSMEFMAYIAENRGRSAQELDAPFKRFLRHYNFTPGEWDKIRTANVLQSPDGAEFFLADAISDRALAERLIGAIIDERRFAVVEPDARVRAVITGGQRRGTFWGEVARSSFMFKSFAMTLFTTHMMRAMTTGPWWSRPFKMAGLMAYMTLAGAISLQTRHLLFGRDPQPMDSPEFWFQAFGYGGGLGIYGDYLYNAVARGSGADIGSTFAGPAALFVSGGLNLTFDAIRALKDGEEHNFGKRLADFTRRNAPGSSLWYTRLLTDRLIFDQIQALVDDDYWRSFQRQEDYYRDQGTSFWFPPGETRPERKPDLERALGPQ